MPLPDAELVSPCSPAATIPPLLSVVWERTVGAMARAQRWARRLADDSAMDAPWASYLRSVYGTVPSKPFDLRTLRWFWWWAPGASNLTRTEVPVWRALLSGEPFVPGLWLERHIAQGGFFLQALQTGPAPVAGHADGSVVEVMRTAHPTGEAPGTSAVFGPEAASRSQVWYWHAPGSGIGLKLGRTLATPNRSELLRVLKRQLYTLPLTVRPTSVPNHMAMRICGGCTAEAWLRFDVLANTSGPVEEMCHFVRLADFDTVQLYAAFGGQRFEIIDCRRAGPAVRSPWLAACPPPEALTHLVRMSGVHDTGTEGRQPCDCSADRAFLNCGDCAQAAPARRTTARGKSKWTAILAPTRQELDNFTAEYFGARDSGA